MNRPTPETFLILINSTQMNIVIMANRNVYSTSIVHVHEKPENCTDSDS